MTHETGRGSQDGFTLIELLVSLTILGVILGLLSGALRVISKNWDAHAEQIDTLDMVSRTADILQRDASALHRVVSALDPKTPRFLFRGDPGHLSFVAIEPPYPTQPGPYFIDYSIVPARNGTNLVRARAPYEPGMLGFAGATEANRVSVMEGNFAYRFSYGGSDNGKVAWFATWPFDKRIPTLIRLDIVDGRSGELAAPPVFATVRADAELSCLAAEPGPCSTDANGELKASSSRQDKAKSNAQAKSQGNTQAGALANAP